MARNRDDNLDYWRKREEEARQNTIKDEAEYNKRLDDIYNLMQQNIEKEINGFYSRYATKNGISMAEAKKRVQNADMEALSRKAEKYVREKDFSDKANEEMALYNLAMKTNRLELLKAQIELELIDGFNDVEHEMEKDLLKTSMKEYERMAGILGKSVKDAEKHAHELVNTSFRNAHFSDRVWYSEWSLKVELERLLRIGLIQGRNPNVLMRDVEKALKVSKYEARRVMVTEMCRVQTGAQKQTYERNGYDQYTFIVEHDDRLCDDCRDLDGQIFYVKDMAPGHNAPPIHPFCVLPGTKIIAPDMEAITRSWYSGLVVEMTLTNGRRLAVTPNHIMLTSRGWVRAKFIRKGDNVFRYCGGVEPNAVESPTNDDGVPAIEKVFATLAKSSTSATRRVPSAPVYLKGDVVPDTEIDVIFTNGELWDKLDTKTRELVSKVGFVGAFELGEIPLNVLSLPAKTLVTMGLAADGIVSGLCELLILRGSPLTHHELVRLRLPSDYDARLIKAASDDGAGNTKGFSECIDALPGEISINNRINVKGLSGVDWDALSDAILSEKTADDTGIMMGNGRNFCDALPGLIQLDNIVDVSLSEYSGHVYDASSLSTLYIANGIITSNCRCSTSAYADRARLDALIAQIEADRKKGH